MKFLSHLGAVAGIVLCSYNIGNAELTEEYHLQVCKILYESFVGIHLSTN